MEAVLPLSVVALAEAKERCWRVGGGGGRGEKASEAPGMWRLPGRCTCAR